MCIDKTEVEFTENTIPSEICFKVKSNEHSGNFGLRFKGKGIAIKVDTLDVYSLHSPVLNYNCDHNTPTPLRVSTNRRSKSTIFMNLDRVIDKLLGLILEQF